MEVLSKSDESKEKLGNKKGLYHLCDKQTLSDPKNAVQHIYSLQISNAEQAVIM